MASLLASLRHRDPAPVRAGHGGADDVLVVMGSVPWENHGPIDVVRGRDLTLDAFAFCRAIAIEAAKTDQLWELRLAILRLALLYGAEAEIFADNAQDWMETTHVTLRPRPPEESTSVGAARAQFTRSPGLSYVVRIAQGELER